MSDESRGTSPWVFVGLGCLAAFVVLVGVVLTVGYLGFRQLRDLQETLEDPEARTGMAAELLATDGIPEGYNAVVAFSVPFLMETVVLSDREPDEDGAIDGFDESGFIYVKTLTFGEQEQELRDFFEGRSDDADLLRQQSINISSRELIGRGSLQETGRALRWVSYRGEIDTRASGESKSGLSSMILVECPGDDRMRMGIWFGPDPDPDAAIDEADLSGSVADESEIQRFMSGFDVCSR